MAYVLGMNGYPSGLHLKPRFKNGGPFKMASEQTIETRTPRQHQMPANADNHFDIDLIDKCNLMCPTCWRGVGAQKNSSATMPLEKFRGIIKKVRAEGYSNVTLINWTEPFLCKTLHEYVPIVKEFGLCCWLSSNLSLPPERYSSTIISALASGVDVLFVSVSGYTQEVYEINHKGGRVDWIKDNLQVIVDNLYSGKLKTNVFVRFLEFAYNSAERSLWLEHANSLGIGFDAVPAWGDPKTPMPSREIFNQHVQDRIDAFEAADHKDGGKGSAETTMPKKVCKLIADRAAVDAKGDAYLCCAYPNAEKLKIGPYLDLDDGELLLLRHAHPFCAKCEVQEMRDMTDHDRGRFRQAIRRKHRSSKVSALQPLLRVGPDVSPPGGQQIAGVNSRIPDALNPSRGLGQRTALLKILRRLWIAGQQRLTSLGADPKPGDRP